MIEVITFTPRGRRIDTAETDDIAAAIRAGQELYDEAHHTVLGGQPSVGFYVDGILVRMVTGRPM